MLRTATVVLFLVPLSASAATSFVPSQSVQLSSVAAFVTTGDLNGDFRSDVVLVSRGGREVTVLLASLQSPTQFESPKVTRFGDRLRQPAAGDLNGDGDVDVAVPDDGAGGVWILIGDGAGSFHAPYLVSVGRYPFAVAIADFDGVRNDDLVVADGKQGRVFFRLNDGETPPRFSVGPDHSIGDKPVEVVAADLNRDANPDVVSLNVGGERAKDVGVLIFERVVAGVPLFGPVTTFAVGENPGSLAASDLNDDGVVDLVMLDRPSADGNGFVDVLLARGDGTFLARESFEIVCPFFTGGLSCPPLALAAGDLDRDGDVDLAIAVTDPRAFSRSDAFQLYTGRGDGHFVANNVFAVAKAPAELAVADVTGDGLADVAVSRRPSTAAQAFVNVSTPGMLPHGSGCILADECVSGRCTNSRCCATECREFEQCNVPGFEGLCVPVAVAAGCTADRDCLGTCRDEPSRECFDEMDCALGDHCDARGCRNRFCCDPTCNPNTERCDLPGFEGVCIAKFSDGDPCLGDVDCISGFCRDGVCCDQDCPGGLCDLVGREGVCQPMLTLGAVCADGLGMPDDGACASGICDCFDLVCCEEVCGVDERCDGEGRCVPLCPRATLTLPPPPACGGGVVAGNETCGDSTVCPGDCDLSGLVEVHELVRGVGIGLGRRPLSDCAAFDEDRDLLVSIAEMVHAVARSICGCV